MMRIVVITLILTLIALSVWAQGLTDVHSHNVMPSYLDFLKSHDALMEEGFPLPEWNVEEHLRAMDEAGMIAHNVPMRYPNIRFVIPHCGSFLPLALQRMQGLLPIVQKAGRMQGVNIEANTRNFYYDRAGGATEETLHSLLTITTSDHILFGSDFPYVNSTTVKQLAERFKNIINNK